MGRAEIGKIVLTSLLDCGMFIGGGDVMSKKSQAASHKITDLTDGSDRTDKLKFTPEVCREMYDALQKIANMNPGESYDEECSIYEDCSTCYDMIDIAKEALQKARGEK